MKYLFIAIIFIVGCNSQSDETKQPKQDKSAQHLKWAKADLEGKAEKIQLMSGVVGISYDSLYNILLDYKVKTGQFYEQDDSTRLQTAQAISDISRKYRLSTKRVSVLIFIYNHEMITKEEIEEEAIENQEPDVDPGDGQEY